MKEETSKYFVVLSQGAYSDYSPNYYVGDIEINQVELDKKGAEVGDLIISEFERLPEREHIPVYSFDHDKVEKYDPTTNETVYQPDFYKWKHLMEVWLSEKGYKKLPSNLPEINVSYSDIPHN